MPIAVLNRIHKSFGQRVLFDDASLSIYRGQRIGLVGANGSGKSTLMRILISNMEAEAGDASIRRGVTVGYLQQDPQFISGSALIDEAELAFEKLHDLANRLREIEHEMAGLDGETLQKALNRYQSVQQEFDAAGGHAWRHRIEATLLGLASRSPCGSRMLRPFLVDSGRGWLWLNCWYRNPICFCWMNRPITLILKRSSGLRITCSSSVAQCY